MSKMVEVPRICQSADGSVSRRAAGPGEAPVGDRELYT